MTRILFGVLVLVCSVQSADAQDSLNMSCVSALEYWQNAQDIQLIGSIAYVTSCVSGLHIVDLSDPANPTEISRCGWRSWGNTCGGICVTGNLAYIGDDFGVLVFDVSNPSHPVQLGEWNEMRMMDIFVHGNAGIGVTDSGYPFVLDVTNPQMIRLTDDVVRGITGPTKPIGMVGNYLCMCGFGCNSGLRIYDFSNPDPLIQIAVADTEFTTYNGTVAGSYAYLTTDSGGLRIYDLTQPVLPVLASVCNSGPCFDVTVTNNHAVIAMQDGTLQVWNVSDPTQPFFESVLITEIPFSRVSGSENLICAAINAVDASNDKAASVIDITDPTVPHVISSFGGIGSLNGMSVNGTIAYLADGRAGLRTVDLGDPTHIVETGRTLDQMSGGLDVAVRGNTAYLSTYERGLCVFDITNPTQPDLITCTQDYEHGLTRLLVVGSYLYAIYRDNGGPSILTFSLQNPALPVCVDTLSVTDIADASFCTANGYLFTGSIRGMFTIYGLTEPAAPLPVGSFDYSTSYTIMDIAVEWPHAFVTIDTDILSILDISDVTQPIPASQINGIAMRVTTSGSNLAITSPGYIIVNDITDIHNHHTRGYYRAHEWIEEMNFYGSYLLTTSANQIRVYRYEGLNVVRPDDETSPQEYTLQPCYPNPFNPNTRITFDLSKTDVVTLKIFDILGRDIATLVDGEMTPGTHAVMFDGSDLPSGIYLYRLQSGSFTQCRKMLLVK